MNSIEKIIDGCKHCIDQSEYSYPCYGCAYEHEEGCTKKLADDVIVSLKRLQYLEKPTPEEQPELPFTESIIRANKIRQAIGDSFC